MHTITIGLVTFFFLRSVGRFSGSKTTKEIIDLGLIFRRKLRKRDYFLVILSEGKIHMPCIGFIPNFLRVKIDAKKWGSLCKLKFFVFSVGCWVYSLVKNSDIKGIFHEKRKMKMLQCNFIFKPTHLNSAIEGGVLSEQNFYSDSVAGIKVTKSGLH